MTSSQADSGGLSDGAYLEPTKNEAYQAHIKETYKKIRIRKPTNVKHVNVNLKIVYIKRIKDATCAST